MKKNTIFKKIAAVAIAISSTAIATSVSSASAQAPSVKDGDKCSKTLYGKSTVTSGVSFKCVYTVATKKYTYKKVASKIAVVAPIDISKLDKTGWPEKFIIGGVPAENSTTMNAKWAGLIKLFNDELGVPVEFYAGTSYAGVIEASIASKVDFVYWGAMSYIVAKLNGAKIEPVGYSKYEDGTTSYTSRLLTKTSQTGITSIKDIKGKKVCLVSATSTSGGLVPMEAWLAAGLTDKDFTTVYAGTHDNSLLKLGAGDCEVAFMYDVAAESIGIKQFAALNKADFKEIWKSSAIPNGPMSVRSTLPASFKAAVVNIMTAKMNKPYFISKGYNGCTAASCNLLEESLVASIVPVTDSYYDPIRRMCEATKAASCKA